VNGFYVTGTDTGVGKTLASTALLRAMARAGVRALGMKPVASGCERIDGAWRNEDALLLQRAGAFAARYEDINPFAFEHPLAPELAARDAHVDVDLSSILDAHVRLSAQADCIVVEGVGGWMAPLSTHLMQADLVRALDIPVVLVVGLRLGCLNHAYLTARAIEADGCRLAGWIATGIDPAMARVDDNLALLRERLRAPCWGVLPFDQAPDAERMSQRLPWPPSAA
jgi:dethiobiotin synthetase